MLRKQHQTFNDGTLKICEVVNSATPGNKPIKNLKEKATLRYEERTVGITRFYAAMQNKVKISLLVRCPLLMKIDTEDIAVIGKEMFEVKQIQHLRDTEIPVMDLTLQKIGERYEFVK